MSVYLGQLELILLVRLGLEPGNVVSGRLRSVDILNTEWETLLWYKTLEY